jgi:hypothetical protein
MAFGKLVFVAEIEQNIILNRDLFDTCEIVYLIKVRYWSCMQQRIRIMVVYLYFQIVHQTITMFEAGKLIFLTTYA